MSTGKTTTKNNGEALDYRAKRGVWPPFCSFYAVRQGGAAQNFEGA